MSGAGSSVTINIRVKLQFRFVIDGMTIKIILERLIGKRHACRSTYITIFRVRVIRAF